MKFYFLAICLFLFTFFSAQDLSKDRTSSNKVYQVTDKMPKYPGGSSAMRDFVQENLQYPEVKGEKLEGTVIINFIIDRKGNVMSTEILNSFQSEYDMEALRVVNEFPKWSPGENDGVPVNVQMALPIKFKP